MESDSYAERAKGAEHPERSWILRVCPRSPALKVFWF
jgi:hypothetical protein